MADRKLAYAADAQLTHTLASLATSAGLVAGRESTAVDNTSNKYLDYSLSGKITTGTSPSASKTIEIWIIAPINDTPTWPDVFDGTDSDETVTSRAILQACGKLAKVISTNDTSDRAYPFHVGSVAMLFGGACPPRFSIFVVHDTGQNLNSTGGNHEVSVAGLYETVA